MKTVYEYRKEIAQNALNNYSIRRDEFEQIKNQFSINREEIKDSIDSLSLNLSCYAGTRPLSCVDAKIFDDNEFILSGCWNGSLYMHSLDDLEEIIAFNNVHDGRVANVRFTSFGFGSCASDGYFFGCSFNHQEKTHEKVLSFLHSSPVEDFVMHPQLPLIFTCEHNGMFHIWDIEIQSPVLSQPAHSLPIYSLDLHPDGQLLATASFDSTVGVWDLRSGERTCWFKKHYDRALGVCFDDTGSRLISSGNDGVLYVHDLRQGTSTKILAHDRLVSTVVSAGNGLILSGDHNGFVVMSDLSTFSPVWKTKAHFGRTTGLVKIKTNNLGFISVGSDKQISYFDEDSW
eukprot:TRINITY_DN3012_c0_g1_i3.p1 TRINITY_DN3012_c0_g1~~TRINITY_DN3012_c0_g1_i3.p1  ORF type:complete len:355 (-),score=87.40 TRINITY_DN3012_c0_g1_i3:408-1442(-)